MKTWAFSLCWALAAGLPAATLRLDIWQLDCSSTPKGAVLEALKSAAKIFKPCGIKIKLGRYEDLSAAYACSLPASESERAPILKKLTLHARELNPQGLSLFVLPLETSGRGDERYSFSIIGKSKNAGCGSPEESRFLPLFGSIFMTDFAFESNDRPLSALLLAHEITHELLQRGHPTHAPRGTILVDHLADIGGKISAEDCACMQQSPYLKL